MYSISKTPKGPSRANKKYTIRPTTTGGMPINEFKIITSVFFKKKLFKAKKNPNIKAKVEEKIKDDKLTFNDKKMILYKA